MLGLALWLISRPFSFLETDGHLYSFLALTHLPNNGLASDLFVRFGSQDTFSVFSYIYAFAIRMSDLATATLLLLFAAGTLWVFATYRAIRALDPGRDPFAPFLLVCS